MRALQERGSAGLEALLAAEKEEGLPEFLRKRPKYYYYYEWMRKRINEQVGSLRECPCKLPACAPAVAWGLSRQLALQGHARCLSCRGMQWMYNVSLLFSPAHTFSQLRRCFDALMYTPP